MEDLTQQDTWLYAKELVTRVLPLLQKERGRVKQFEYEREGNSYRISGSETESIVGFSIEAWIAPEHFSDIVYFEDKIVHTLHSNGIESENQDVGNYPHFSYKWIGENRNPSEKGKLHWLRVDLAGDTFVKYEGRDFKAFKRREGQKALLDKMPNKLLGLDELLGTTIPWQIDYEARAREILEKTGLEEFVKAIESNKKR